MDNIEPLKQDTTDIRQKIFNQFIEDLKKTDVPMATIQQLEKAVVTEGNLSELAIRTALTSQPAS